MRVSEAVIQYKSKYQRRRELAESHPGASGPNVIVRKLGRKDDHSLHSSTGAVYSHWQEAPLMAQCLMMLVEFAKLVQQQGLDVEEVHSQFLKIDEYRQLLPSDHPDFETAGSELNAAFDRLYK